MLDGDFPEIALHLLKSLAATVLTVTLAAAAQPPAQATPGDAQATPGQKMAATVIAKWPAGSSSQSGPGKWAYEEGVLLDGIAGMWHVTGDGRDFAYIKASVDKYVEPDGAIRGYNDQHTLDDIEMGRADLLVYRVTQDPKYAKAAEFLHERLAAQPRTASGGYWHKQVYPNQMWLDGAYMAEPFRAAYAATFGESADFDDIAHQLLLMDQHMRDTKTGLLRHGWDESKAMPWADKATGLSPEVWGRAMGWYAMALVDVLDWFPKDHPQHAALVAALQRNMAAIVKAQDPASGLWWQVMTHPGEKGNYFEASASCMFTYALAKGVRQGYLPVTDEAAARRGWDGINAKFITTDADGTETLHGTVRVGGLGGKPYRSGTFDYYLSEKVADDDSKGVGAYMLAASEMQQASTATLARGKTVLMDAWFNSQTRKTALGNTELFHYKWTDDSNNGYSLFGRAFRRYGATLATLPAAPTAAALAKAQVYIIASPDNPSKNPNPHYMDKASADTIVTWVRNGGNLLLFSNDRDNTDFNHFNLLADQLGIHFNPVLSHHVVGDDHTAGEVAIPAIPGLFPHAFTAYMKDTSTITVSKGAKAIVTDHGDVMLAIAHFGKGRVLAVVDPWFYNEYADGRKLGQYHGFEAARDVAAWALGHPLLNRP
ncbi:MAG TPA: glycoside hydrolase family 88 protein [Acidobacteriaceae bacterium]|nr:glycoside hydrolase family 88 protein [Acidobacteriaceae bacterium]